MITSEQATAIVNEFASKLDTSKNFDVMRQILPLVGSTEALEKTSNDAIANLPELWPGYRFAVKQMRDILSHAQRDTFPEHLFIDMGPNAKKRDIIFAKRNFKAITLPVWMDFINTVKRAFQDGNWSIDYREQEEYKMYVEKELPIYCNLEGFIKDVLTDTKLKDANGIVAVMPYRLNYLRDGEGAIVLDEQGFATLSDELIAPYPVYFSSKSIINQLEGVYYAVISSEKSDVKVGNQIKKEGIVIDIFDSEKIVRISQIGDKEKKKFGQPTVFFQHNLGYIPAYKLKGVPYASPDAINTVGLLYASQFSYCVDNLDRVLTDDATLEIVKKKCGFPYMIAVGNPCEFTLNNNQCIKGKIYDPESTKDIICPSCEGTGLTNRLSPSGELLIHPGGMSDTDMGDTNLKGEYIKFVSPDPTMLEFLEQQKKDNENRARRIIHIKDVNGKFNYNSDQTATGSDNELKAMNALILPISDQIFELYSDISNCIGKMRYGDAFEGVDITRPQSFDLSSPSDYLELINTLSEIGVSPTITRMVVMKYLQSLFYSDSQATRALEVIMQADKLLPFTNEVVATKVERGVAEKWQEVLHDQATVLIMRLVENDANYFELDMAEKVARLEQAAKDATPQAAVEIDLAAQLLNNI